jgi:hypothetical protein
MRGFSWVCVVLAVTGLGSLVSPGRVEAGMLRLNMSGTTSNAAEFAGSGIPVGTSWSLVADFDPATLTTEDGAFYFAPTTSLTVMVGTTTYTPSVTDTIVALLGPFNGLYSAGISDGAKQSAIVPLFSSTSNPNWTASAPTSTEFLQPSSAISLLWRLPTSDGELILDSKFDGISASITNASSPAVPEPSLVSLAIGGAAFGLVALRRRARRG